MDFRMAAMSDVPSIACFVVWSGSRKLVLSDICIPQHLSPVPSDQQHGKESRKEGRSRSPQGDESDEGKEGIEVSCHSEDLYTDSILDRLYFNTCL